MKKSAVLVLAALLAGPTALAEPVYDNYAAYYQTLNGIFRALGSFKVQGARNAVVYWKGQRFELKRAKVFPGEIAVNDDLGPRAVGFERGPYACVQGQSSSSSGTAVRHYSVYLLDANATGNAKIYKLPSLFASCAAVRLDEQGRPLFYDAGYIYGPGSDVPVGLTLSEFVINRAEFVPTGHSVVTRFVEPENVWKFQVVTSK
jgi:hypothetical protein